MVEFALAGQHLVDGEYGSQDNIGALAHGDVGDVLGQLAGDGTFPVGRLGLVDMTEAAGYRSDVHGGVTTTDYHHAVADSFQAAIVEGLEEGRSGDDVGNIIGTFGRKGTTTLGAKAEEHGIVVLADLFHAEIDTHFALQLDLNAQIDNPLNFGVKYIARCAIARDAVAHHAAQVLMIVEDRDRVTLEGELVGHRQAGGTTAEHGNFFAGLFRGFDELQIVLDRVLAEVMLDRVDADVIFNLVAVASGFAWCRANATHHSGQRVGLGEATPGIFLYGHDGLAIGTDGGLFDAAHDVQVTANVFAGRAGTLAGGGGLDIGRALMRPASLEDIVLQALELLRFAVLELAEGQLFGLAFVGR